MIDLMALWSGTEIRTAASLVSAAAVVNDCYSSHSVASAVVVAAAMNSGSLGLSPPGSEVFSSSAPY